MYIAYFGERERRKKTYNVTQTLQFRDKYIYEQEPDEFSKQIFYETVCCRYYTGIGLLYRIRILYVGIWILRVCNICRNF